VPILVTIVMTTLQRVSAECCDRTPWGPRYVVPLVFYTMLRRWTTRRSEEKWPHRPLAGDEVSTHKYVLLTNGLSERKV